MKFFSLDSPVYRFMSALLNVVTLNFCWLIACLPIITIGPATVAAFDVALKMVDDEEGYIVKQFIKAFKSNFKQGVLLGIISFICIYVVYMDFQLFEAVEGNPVMFLIIAIVSCFVFVCSLIYAYPLIARYENTVGKTLKNSFRISMKYIVRTVMMIFVVGVECFVFLWNDVLVFIGILIGPACIMYTISGFAKYIFKQIELQPGAVVVKTVSETENNEENNEDENIED